MVPASACGSPASIPSADEAAAALIDAVAAFRLALQTHGSHAPEHLIRQVRREAEDLVRLCAGRSWA